MSLRQQTFHPPCTLCSVPTITTCDLCTAPICSGHPDRCEPCIDKERKRRLATYRTVIGALSAFFVGLFLAVIVVTSDESPIVTATMLAFATIYFLPYTSD